MEAGYVEEDDGVFSIFFRLAKPGDGLEQGHEIANRYGLADNNISFHYTLLASEGYIINSLVLILYAVGGILGLVIMAGSIIVIANAFAITTGERVRQFGILKSTGATSEQIRMSVLFEGLLLSAIGIPLGILAGLGLELIGVSIANTFTADIGYANISNIEFPMIISLSAILISVISSFITVLLSAWFPARKVSEISAIDAIRLTDEVKLRSHSVKTSWLTHKVFGFEGTLAVKSLKRSRRKYRATVISLVVSIVFVLVSSSFGDMLFTILSMLYPSVDAANATYINSIYLLTMIFVYGFIGMLSLIGITSVTSTIFTNIRLRAQEFAVLKSVGMTTDGLRKMLNLESFLYGLKSLFIGLPLGLVLSYGMNCLFGLVVKFSFSIPWTSMGICVLSVMAITFMTMHHAAKQSKPNSIVETMRMVDGG